MRVSLINVDSKIPNLALMQASAYLKSKGHQVALNLADPNEVYISCVFVKNRPKALGIAKMFPEATIHLGGSGINYNWLPEEMQKVKPDYDLYPSTYSQGFTTRGCIRRCPFCIVPAKEGRFQKWQHPSEFVDPRFDTLMLMDNNWLADREWFFETSQWILDSGIKLIEGGMDIRLMTPEIAARLAEMTFAKPMHFAFDNMQDEKAVRRGVDILREAGIDLRRNILFYVLVGYNSLPDQDLYRCRLLKTLGTGAFVMQYRQTPFTRALARWANRPTLFQSIDFSEYNRFKVRT